MPITEQSQLVQLGNTCGEIWSSAGKKKSPKVNFTPQEFHDKITNWYKKNKRELPWRLLWEKFKNPYHIWVSEVMLQQTVIKAVIPVYHRFLSTFPSLYDLSCAQEEQVRKAVRGLGYYSRFRRLHAGARKICDQSKHPQINWPKNFQEWKEIPGVGDYTAAAVSSIAFNKPNAVVDGNVERLFCRLWDIRLAPNLPQLKKIFQKINQLLIDQQAPGDYNQGLMEIGQRICLVGEPLCASCPLKSHCISYQKKTYHLAPAPKIKPQPIEINMKLTVIHHKGLFGVLKRPNDAKFLKDIPGFLTELQHGTRYACDGSSQLSSLKKVRTMGTIKHQITKHKINAKVCIAESPRKLRHSFLTWLQAKQVDENLTANLDRKAWQYYLKTVTD